MEQAISESYAGRLTRVSAYIHDHLDEELSLDMLAEIACLSPYHWHRIYHTHFGETVTATVRRLRLQRAAADLAHTDRPIAKVAERAGYDSQASFTRAFSAAFGIAARHVPRVRQSLGFQSSPQCLKEFTSCTMIGTTTVSPLCTLIAVEHRGPYMAIGKSYRPTLHHAGAAQALSGRISAWSAFILTIRPAFRKQELRSQAASLCRFHEASMRRFS